MKKISLLFLVLLFALNTNGCVEKSIITNPNNNQPAVVVAPTQEPVSSPSINRTVRTSSSERGYQQLLTVQGPTLAVQERSNGFVFPQYKNKIILLQIFGQDCPYCFKEMPIINSIKRKYSRNLQIVALQAQEAMSKETASRLIQKFQMNYPIIDKDEAKSLLYFIQKTYGWTGILPYMLIIKNGVTEYSFAGEVSHKELDSAVKSLL